MKRFLFFRKVISFLILFFYLFSLNSLVWGQASSSSLDLKVIKVNPISGKLSFIPKSFQITFNQKVKKETVNIFTLLLQKEGKPIYGKIKTYDGRTFLFIPADTLEVGKKYSLVLNSEIKSLSGKRLKEKKVFTYFLPKNIEKKEEVKKEQKIVKAVKKEIKTEEKISTVKNKDKVISTINSKEIELTTNIKDKKLWFNKPIIINFNLPLSSDSLSHIYLLDEKEKEVPVQKLYLKGLKRLILKPKEFLEKGKEYGLVIEKQIKTLDGQQGLKDDFILVFKAVSPVGEVKVVSKKEEKRNLLPQQSVQKKIVELPEKKAVEGKSNVVKEGKKSRKKEGFWGKIKSKLSRLFRRKKKEEKKEKKESPKKETKVVLTETKKEEGEQKKDVLVTKKVEKREELSNKEKLKRILVERQKKKETLSTKVVKTNSNSKSLNETKKVEKKTIPPKTANKVNLNDLKMQLELAVEEEIAKKRRKDAKKVKETKVVKPPKENSDELDKFLKSLAQKKSKTSPSSVKKEGKVLTKKVVSSKKTEKGKNVKVIIKKEVSTTAKKPLNSTNKGSDLTKFLSSLDKVSLDEELKKSSLKEKKNSLIPLKLKSNLNNFQLKQEKIKVFTVVSTYPVDGSSKYDPERKIEIVFSDVFDEKTVNIFTIKLKNLTDNKLISCNLEKYPQHHKILISPQEGLKEGKIYQLFVSNQIKNKDGLPLDNKYRIKFKLKEREDKTPPQIVSVIPSIGEKNVKVDTKVIVKFSEPIERKSLNVFNFTLYQGDKPVYGNVIYKEDEREGVFVPETTLKYNKTYTATIDGNVMDKAGNFMKTAFSWSFTTEKKPDVIAPFITGKKPLDNAKNVDVNKTIEIYFSEPIDKKSITPFSVIVSDGSNNVLCKYILSQDGKKLIVAPEKALKYGTIYRVKVQNIMDLAGNILLKPESWIFETENKADTTPPYVVKVNPSNNSVEVSVYQKIQIKFSELLNPATLGKDSFAFLEDSTNPLDFKVIYNNKKREVILQPYRKLSYNTTYTLLIKRKIEDIAGNKLDKPYRVDFRTQERPDYTPPTILAAFPMANQVIKEDKPQIKIIFSEPLDPASVTERTVQLESETGKKIPLVVKYDKKMRTIFATVKERLKENAIYTVCILPTVRDLQGNKMVKGIKWSFQGKFQKIDTTPPKIVSVSPEVGGKNVDPKTFISITFSERLNPKSVNLFNFQLLNEKGFKKEVKLFYDDLAKIVVLKPKEELLPGKEYRVLVKSKVSDLTGNRLGKKFSWKFRVRKSQPKKDSLEEEVSKYISSHKPVFKTQKELMVLSSIPAQNTKDVPVDTDIKIFFNNPLDVKSVSRESVFIIDELGQEMDFNWSFSEKNNRLLLRLKKKLEKKRGYSVILVSDLLRDIYGNKLATDYVLNFRTYGERENTFVEKITKSKKRSKKSLKPLLVVSSSPKNGAIDVSLSPQISVVFSQKIDSVTLNENTFILDDGKKRIPGKVLYNKDTKTAVFIPRVPLISGKVYRVTVKEDITSQEGMPLKDDYIFSFKTKEEGGVRIVSTYPVDGENNFPITSNLWVKFSQPVLKITLNPFNFYLLDEKTQTRVKGYIKYSLTEGKAYFLPEKPLKKDKHYIFTITKGVQDVEGNFLKEGKEIKFKTEK